MNDKPLALEICPGCGRRVVKVTHDQRFCNGCGVFPNVPIHPDRMIAEAGFQLAIYKAKIEGAKMCMDHWVRQGDHLLSESWPQDRINGMAKIIVDEQEQFG